MLHFVTSLPQNIYVELPHFWYEWVGFVLLFVVFLIAMRYWWESFYEKLAEYWWQFLLLVVLTPLFSVVGQLQIFSSGTPLPNLPVEGGIPTAYIFLAIPWVIVGGVIGVAPSVFLALFSGILLSIFWTHSIFTPLQIGGLALVYCISIRQNYRTRFYSLLRIPIFAACVASIVMIPIFMFSSFFSANGALAVRLDYAISKIWGFVAARAVELLFGGIIATILYYWKRKIWFSPKILRPSPSETNLQTRLFYGTMPLVGLLSIVLVLGDWVVAGNASRQVIEQQLSGTAKVAAESLPFFMETGQNLIFSIAKNDFSQRSEDEIVAQLSTDLREVPYFRQLYVFSVDGNPVTGYPLSDFNSLRMSAEEMAGVKLAADGVLIQTYTLPPWPGESTAQISFITPIKDSNGNINGVLMGRTDLNSNPFSQPAIQALNTIAESGGEGVVLDENQVVLYHSTPDSDQVMKKYAGNISEKEKLFEDISATGTRQLSYYYVLSGRPWGILLSVPAQNVQELSLNIAMPLLGILFAIVAISFIAVRFGLRSVTANLQTLAGQASKISQGDLDSQLDLGSVDEIGKLSTAFEKMRFSLKSRMLELNQLLVVSEGVAKNLDIQKAVKPILDASIQHGAISARVALIHDVRAEPGSDDLVCFGSGEKSDSYAHMDELMFDMVKDQDIFPVHNISRMRRLNVRSGPLTPVALIAIALHHEDKYYGAFWIAYDKPQSFNEEDVRYLSTLASEAAMAAANATLFARTEIDRQRLEAVLSSTPEPVIVIDDRNRLLLLNPTAVQLPGLIASTTPGSPMEEVIKLPDLLDFLRSPLEERTTSREIRLPNDHYSYASIAPVISNGKLVGKVCILRDITHFKELDSLKSDIVSTVSHDLRTPLTLMRGYATMLQMVGELNEQQRTYISKIVTGVENMTGLVNNLLDLGRIEAGIDLRVEKIYPGVVLEQVMNTLHPQALQKNIKIVLENKASPSFTVEADTSLLNQAIFNLVENAIKFTQVGGKVDLMLEEKDGMALFTIRDNGIGIAPLDSPRLFEKFFRSGRREAYSQRGTGLGLAIVKSIVDRHHGKIMVDSQLGKGSTFYFTIPSHQP